MNILKRLSKKPIMISFLLITIVIVLFTSFCHFDNDIWFIISSGKYILKNGIPYHEVLTMHTSFSVVMQQWLASIIFYGSYLLMGAKGITIVVGIVSMLLIYTLYKYSYHFTKNSTITSLLLMVFCFFSLRYYTVSRPQIFTYLILTLELFLSEKYYETGKTKYLYALPVLSLLEINLHASMWFLQFCFVGTFIFDSFKDKKKLKNFILILIAMGLVGFVNPYGIDAMTYVFKSYNIPVLNEYINEMKPATIRDLYVKVGLVFMFLILALNGVSKKKLPLRYIILLARTCYLAGSNVKSINYLYIALVITMSYLLNNVELSTIFNKLLKKNIFKKDYRLLTPIRFVICVLSYCCLIGGIYYACSISNLSYFMESAVNVLEEDAQSKDVKIFTRYELGGYLEWCGYKPYIDARGDVFIKSTNNVFDIMNEFYHYTADKKYRDQLLTLFEKYDFDYIIIADDTFEYDFLETHETNYKQIYRDPVESEQPMKAVLYKKVTP